MPFRLRLIDAGGMVLVRAVGPADPEDWLQLADHPMLARHGPGLCLLIDLRRRATLPTARAARTTGERFAKKASSLFEAVAILTQPGAQYGLARMVETLTELRGMPARAFTDRGEAVAWLRRQVGPQPAPELRPPPNSAAPRP